MALPSVEDIERAGIRAWPALDTAHDGQWVLRAAGGYTNRANSVQSLDAADDADAATRLARAVRWYADRRLPPVFRVTPLAGPGILRALDNWTVFGQSHVLALDFDKRAFPDDPAVVLRAPTAPEWLAAQQQLQGYGEGTRERLRHVVGRIKAPARGIVLMGADGQPAAAALFVVVAGLVYTGNVVTAAGQRRQGLARRLLLAGMGWARQAGGRRAAIQVAADNAPAIALYAGLGYTHHYDYHYRRPDR